LSPQMGKLLQGRFAVRHHCRTDPCLDPPECAHRLLSRIRRSAAGQSNRQSRSSVNYGCYVQGRGQAQTACESRLAECLPRQLERPPSKERCPTRSRLWPPQHPYRCHQEVRLHRCSASTARTLSPVSHRHPAGELCTNFLGVSLAQCVITADPLLWRACFRRATICGQRTPTCIPLAGRRFMLRSYGFWKRHSHAFFRARVRRCRAAARHSTGPAAAAMKTPSAASAPLAPALHAVMKRACWFFATPAWDDVYGFCANQCVEEERPRRIRGTLSCERATVTDPPYARSGDG